MTPLRRLLHFPFPSIPSKAIPFFSSLFHNPLPSYSSLSSSEEPPLQSHPTNPILTHEDLTHFNLLIPRLCHSNQLATAINLTTTLLLTNPPLNSLSLPLFIDSLSSQPDMTHAMSLLTRLKFTPTSYPYLRPIILMLLTSYFDKSKCKEALKVFTWMQRYDSPCSPDEEIYGILVHGFCRNGFLLEGLKVFKAMVGANMVPSCDLRECVYRGLLRQAWIKEAKELNDAFVCVDVEGPKRISLLLERMVAEWKD